MATTGPADGGPGVMKSTSLFFAVSWTLHCERLSWSAGDNSPALGSPRNALHSGRRSLLSGLSKRVILTFVPLKTASPVASPHLGSIPQDSLRVQTSEMSPQEQVLSPDRLFCPDCHPLRVYSEAACFLKAPVEGAPTVSDAARGWG